MVRVLLADDHHLVTSALRVLLEAADFDVTGTVTDADGIRAAFDQPRERQPAVALCDLDMPGVGLAALGELTAFLRQHGCRTMVLSAFFSPPTVTQVLQAGAHGFIRKTTRPDEIVQLLRAVAAGDVDVMDAVTARRVAETRRDSPPLTAREVEVLALLSDGLTNGKIAKRLYISPDTVKSHVDKLRTKLSASTRTAIARQAWELGLITTADAERTRQCRT